jgi:REP element-mobilizing transposase RayT
VNATKLIESARYYHDQGIWWLRMLVLMPDHLHALVAVPVGRSLPVVVRRWKAYQHAQLGIEWQSGYFDHRLRSNESLDEKAHYIRMNPVRAGLVSHPEDWPHAWPLSDVARGGSASSLNEPPLLRV